MGYKVLGQIDRERYTDMSHDGLEGPFMFESVSYTHLTLPTKA